MRKFSGQPKLSSALSTWKSRITLLRHTEKVVDGLVQIRETPISFYGMIQPLSPRAIALKPEGQRSWTWLQIHCQAQATNLVPGDKVSWCGDRYKVMARLDYSLNGYVEYHLVRDYQNSGTP